MSNYRSIDYRSERRIRNNRMRRRKEMHKNILLVIMTLCLVVTFSLSVNSFLSNAKTGNDVVSHKYYKSITISNGDTLWSIAQEYMAEEHYDSINDYIKEVKSLNSLKSDNISYGASIIVPYYSL